MLWVVIVFILAVFLAVFLSVWSSVLVIQINPATTTTVVMMIIGILAAIVLLLGLVYLFLRLIQSVRLNLAQSLFISAVTHELRSPVTSLQILSETLQNPALPDDKRRDFEASMRSEIKRLKDVVDQVLETARLETLFKKAPTEAMEMNPWLQELFGRFEKRAIASNGKASLHLPNDPVRASINPRLFRMALENLLDNAFKYSPTKPVVSLRIEPANEKVRISVEDRGVGIPEKDQKKIFRRFYRSSLSSPANTVQGTGLGLYFAKLAISAQGGTIKVRSTDSGPNRGSTFEIEVPRR